MSSLKSNLNIRLKRNYVGRFAQTEVMPANAPLIKRVGVSSSFGLLRVKSYRGFTSRTARVGGPLFTDLFQLLVGRELHGTIRHYPQAVDAIPSHEA